MNIKPLHDRIVVERIEEDTLSAGGIVIPDSAKEKPDQGIVKSVGPGKRTDDGKVLKPEVKVGDRVLFGKYAGTGIKLDGKELMVIREEDVLAVIVGGKGK
ncbi:MAG: co-chaperone GroES [Betaproteobacteria bacterium AqS2]|uniref:Co-chaperonin GroES n=1 Tax=Candidatus Amphirhobacter heronislandensis TaxID=1732024 RepID=A0A930XW86_9GAMM|nr:co-chaperone GroES [Betaproteobacteria bacterium AqS2]